MVGTSPGITWCKKMGGDCLRFTFSEMLTESEAEVAIAKWKDAFNQKQDKCISLIWDCTKMKNYESGARKKWTNALFEMKPRIGTIWLISDSPIIRMGATVMGMATSLHIRMLGSDNDMIN